jgi:hypothetical protein
MTLIGGVPAHPLIIHAVVVLLPLAALGSLLLAIRPAWRRRFGVVVLLITAAGVGAVPLAVATGEQLQAVLPGGNPLILEHVRRALTLQPYAIAFGVLVLATVLLDYRAGADGRGRRTAPGRHRPFRACARGRGRGDRAGRLDR